MTNGSRPPLSDLRDWRWMAPLLAAALSWTLIPAAIFGLLAAVQLLTPTGWNRSASLWLQGPQEFALTVIGVVTQEAFLAQVILPLAGLAFLWFVWRRRWLLAISVAAVVPMVALEVILKYLLEVPSASSYLDVRVLVRQPGVPTALEHGFPSGHASRAAFVLGWLAFLLTPARYRKPVFIGLAVLTLFVCWTRIYVGDHSLLEILAGIALAITFLVPAAALIQLDRAGGQGPSLRSG